MPTNVVMPQLGESVVEGTIGRWFKKVGDPVEQYESIMEVVTDKVTTEIPSPAAGTLLEIRVPDGATVNAGTILGVIGERQPSGESNAERQPAPAAPAAQSSGPSARPAQSVAPATAPAPAEQAVPEMRLTPVVARMISEYNIRAQELQAIRGTGQGGRISKKDLEAYIATRGQAQAPAPAESSRPAAQSAGPSAAPELAAWEQPGTGELFRPTEEVFGKVEKKAPVAQSVAHPADGGGVRDTSQRAEPASDSERSHRGTAPSPGPREELEPLGTMRKAIAEHMVRSVQTAPHVTTVHEADLSRVIAHMHRHQEEFQQRGAKLTYTAYLVEGVVAALRAVPLANALYTEQGVLMKHYIHIGIAVAVPEGLIVPVIKNADEKNLLGLARAVNDLAARAREKKLTPDEVQGGTFTITNYGVFGSLFGTPIINQPQSAILGVGAVQKRVIVIDDAIAIRPMVYLGLTFDHRLLDGATGDQFMNALKKHLTEYPDA